MTQITAQNGHIAPSWTLTARLKIYTFISNYVKKKTEKIDTKRIKKTPAMHLGIFDEFIEPPY